MLALIRIFFGLKKIEFRIRSFRTGETRVLVATNVLGRGMDIDGVTHVVMLEFDKIEGTLLGINRVI